MSTPEIPSDPPPPSVGGGGNFIDNLRAKFGPTPALIAFLTAGGVAAIQFAKSEAGAWPIVVLVSVAIVASIYCAKNRIH
jgi:hypothetical protein